MIVIGKTLRVILVTNWSIWIRKVVIIVISVLILLLLRLRVVNKTVLVGRYWHISITIVSKFLQVEGLLDDYVLDIIWKVIYLKFLRFFFKICFFLFNWNLKTKIMNFCLIPDIMSCLADNSFWISGRILGIITLLRNGPSIVTRFIATY